MSNRPVPEEDTPERTAGRSTSDESPSAVVSDSASLRKDHLQTVDLDFVTGSSQSDKERHKKFLDVVKEFSKLQQPPVASSAIIDESSEEEINYDFCRICHDNDREEALISPCRCKGSLSLVHRSCLERWLAEADSSSCELCGYTYKTKRFPKYRMIPSVWAWLRSAETRRERRDLGLDLMALCAFTPIVIMGTYLGLLMADSLYTPALEDSFFDYEETDLNVVSTALLLDLAFFAWVILKIRFYKNQWLKWHRKHHLPQPEDPSQWFPEGRVTSYLTGSGLLSVREGDWRMLTSISTRIATLSVVSFMCTLDLAFASWLIFRLQHHISQWYYWYRRNCKVQIVTSRNETVATRTNANGATST